jgi:hypothetical protein
MAYFPDLTDYTYAKWGVYPGSAAVGWLAAGHPVPTSAPSEALLDRLWEFCKVSVAQLRGVHDCDLCNDEGAHFVERKGETLLLGTSEIRVFGTAGEVYAAPTLIYHYVAVHHYAPPDEFVRALHEGLAPPDPAYFARIAEIGLEWNKTSAPTEKPRRIRLGAVE